MKILLSALLFCFCCHSFAQKTPSPDYKTAIGAKFYPLALSIKHMTGERSAVEVLGYFREGFRLTALFEYYGVLNQGGNLKWFIGGGGHLGWSDKDHGNDFKIGVDGVIGLDYKFMRLPLNLSIDWQPSYGFGDDKNFVGDWGGIGVRFCF